MTAPEVVSFGVLLRHYRLAVNLSQEALSESAHLSVDAIAALERGRRTTPRSATVALLADALVLSAADRALFVAAAARGRERSTALQGTQAASRSGALLRNFPAQQTPFVGRVDEVAQVAQHLHDPACRLLTLLGPGGTGKTRLADQSGRQAAASFADGAVFVPLAAVAAAGAGTATRIAGSVAAALDLPLSGPVDPQTQLIGHLRDKQLLLMLDNVEHLLDGVRLLHDLLEHAPQLTILATSRERLNLQAEWLIDVAGMAFPIYAVLDVIERDPRFQRAAPTPAQLEPYAAVQLFCQCAQRVQPHFQLAPHTIPAVLQICQLVEGLPLAIELAAAWVRTVPCDQIAAEIARNVDFLTTTLRDVPQRQRSMRAVFEHSWALLTDDERATLSSIAVFRGGWTLEAATAVSGEHNVAQQRALLAALIDKSLLRCDAQGRYDMHELVRQYASERLAAVPGMAARACQRHGHFYANWLQQHESQLFGRQQAETLEGIAVELENARAAWRGAIERRDTAVLNQSVQSIATFYEARSPLQEGAVLFKQAAAALCAERGGAAHDALYARLLIRQAIFCERLGTYAEGDALLQCCMALLGADGDPRELALALTTLGRIADRQGRYHASYEHHQRSLHLYRAHGDRWGAATALYNLGSACEGLQQYDEARGYLTESLAIRRTIGDQRGEAFSLNLLGIVTEMQQAYDEAQRCYQESLALFSSLGDRWAMLLPLANLGDVAVTLGTYATAQRYYLRVLQIGLELWSVPKMLSALFRIATVIAHDGNTEQAIELLALPLAYPATEQAFRERAQALLDTLSARVSPQAVAQALERGRARTLEATVQPLLHDK